MEFKTLTPEIITEENIKAGDQICYIEIDAGEDANLSFYLESEYNEYFNTQQSGTTLKVFITDNGVSAINQDYPEDPTREITKLVYKITVKDNDTDETISQDVENDVIRVHDEPPYIVDTYIEQLFTENLTDNMRVAVINTTYVSSFAMTGDLYNYFKFDELTNGTINSGKLLLTPEGLDFFANLEWENNALVKEERGLQYQEFTPEFIITDVENGLTLGSSITIKIYKGNKDLLLPTKNMLELVAEAMAEPLGNEVGKQHGINYKVNNLIENIENQIEFILSKNNIYYKEIEELKLKLDELKRSIEEAQDYRDFNFESFLNTFSYINFKKIYSANAELHGYYKNDDFLNDTKLLGQSYGGLAIGESGIEVNEITLDYLWKFIKYWIEIKIALTVNTIDEKMDFIRDIINNTVTPKYDSYFSKVVEALNDHNKRIINNLNNIGILDYRAKQADQFLVDHNERIKDIEGYDLTDWDVLDDNGNIDGWNFTSTALKMKSEEVLHASDGGDTKLISESSDVKLVNSESKELKWTGQELIADSGNAGSKMKAETFEGTATKALYADIAEFYLADTNYPSGTILQLELSDNENEVSIYDGRYPVAGIVTTNPAFIMNTEKENEDNWVCIALAGRVPVKCSNSIKKGMHVYADTKYPGLAFGSYKKRDFDLIGYALEDSKDGYCLIKVAY